MYIFNFFSGLQQTGLEAVSTKIFWSGGYEKLIDIWEGL